MIKRSTKQRIVEYEESDIVCDLCEKVIPKDSSFMTLQPNVAMGNGYKFPNNDGTRNVEICTTECLLKHVGAAAILMNTKILPAIKSDYDKDAVSRRNAELDLEKYSQLTKTFKPTVSDRTIYPGKMDITWTSNSGGTTCTDNSLGGFSTK